MWPRTRLATAACAPELEFREVDQATWPDMQHLFESRGGPKNCWCMVWRATGEEARRTDGASRKAAMARRLDAGVPVGLLGYLDGEPVAWCSIAPRETYRPLGGTNDAPCGRERVWSIACFFVKRELRGGGVTAQLIDAAVAHARRRGATVVEAYPVDPDSPSYRFMGFVSSFAAAGFREAGRAGSRRHVMRLELGRGGRRRATASR
ncbi:MAG: GNAT family N-acetyltransferase [Dehalococcoidia bacterium]|nr:MAG: GNAT family N-acetyltransferase [Dehalococcoidia bacterium]